MSEFDVEEKLAAKIKKNKEDIRHCDPYAIASIMHQIEEWERSSDSVDLSAHLRKTEGIRSGLNRSGQSDCNHLEVFLFFRLV